MTSRAQTFIETSEHRRFQEFCEGCIRYGHIGLCYGLPGVGKTLSARQVAQWDQAETADINNFLSSAPAKPLDTCIVYYNVPVANRSNQINRDLTHLRERMKSWSGPMFELSKQMQPLLEEAAARFHKERRLMVQRDREISHGEFYNAQSSPKWDDLSNELAARKKELKDPTRLVIIDEADRLSSASLEQLRYMYDGDNVPLILIGMPGLEKRFSRYAQFSSRVGWVHNFRRLSREEMGRLLKERAGMMTANLPEGTMTDEEGVAAIIRMTGGNLRLVNRLLVQVCRILELNELRLITRDVVEAAREHLVMGID